MVGETLASGTNVENRKAFVDRLDGKGHVRRSHLLVSTERHGDTVLLKIHVRE